MAVRLTTLGVDGSTRSRLTAPSTRAARTAQVSRSADVSTSARRAIRPRLTADDRVDCNSRLLTAAGVPQRAKQLPEFALLASPVSIDGGELDFTRSLLNGRGRPLQAIDRTPHAESAPIEDVHVDHRRAHIRVAQQLLHCPDVRLVILAFRAAAVTARCMTVSCRR